MAPAALIAWGTEPVPIAERAKGAERVLLARVAAVEATRETNEFGDALIVSHVKLQVEESLKGQHEPSVTVDVLGGTVGDLTLEVSSLPRMIQGERAVFFLSRDTRNGRFVPHLKGQGILKLDESEKVKGSSLALSTIREITRAAAGK
jgi:hypothetical protein